MLMRKKGRKRKRKEERTYFLLKKLPLLFATFVVSSFCWMKNCANVLLLASFIACARKDTTFFFVAHSVKQSGVSLHVLCESKDGLRSGVGNTVFSLCIIKSAPLDLTSFVNFRKIHVEGPPILDIIVLGRIKDVATERRILMSTRNKGGCKVGNMEITRGVVTKQLEGIDVAMAPETALDDAVVSLQAFKEWLLEMTLEASSVTTNRNMTSNVHNFTSLLGLFELRAHPGDLSSRILNVLGLGVVDIVKDGVQHDQTKLLVDFDRVKATLLESSNGVFG